MRRHLKPLRKVIGAQVVSASDPSLPGREQFILERPRRDRQKASGAHPARLFNLSSLFRVIATSGSTRPSASKLSFVMHLLAAA